MDGRMNERQRAAVVWPADERETGETGEGGREPLVVAGSEADEGVRGRWAYRAMRYPS